MIASRPAVLPFQSMLFALADAACAAGALVLAVSLRLGWGGWDSYVWSRLPVLLAAWALLPFVAYLCGAYRLTGRETAAGLVLPVLASVLVGTLAGGLLLWAMDYPSVGRGIALEYGLLLFAGMVTIRFAWTAAVRVHLLEHRCLVVGSEALGARVAELLRDHPETDLCVVGRVGPSARGGSPWPAADGCPLLGATTELERLVRLHRVDQLILHTHLERDPALFRTLRMLRYRGVAIQSYLSLHERLAQEIPVDLIDDAWLLQAATTSSRLHIRRLKRLIDVTCSALLLVPTALVVLPLAALAIRLDSPGPVLYRQERLGLGGRTFQLLKFRTMRADAEQASGPAWSADRDPRITRVGRLLRRYRIDELPQLWNVLRGEMSLIGPRPERPVLCSRIEESVPFFSERLWVRPGITGWAQVMAPYAASVGDSYRKLQYDIYYTKNLSLLLDAVIAFKTVKTMLFGRERAQGGLRAGHQLQATGTTALAAAAPLASAEPPAENGPISQAG